MDYIELNIHPEDILILGKLIFPDFVEVDGVVLLALLFDEETYKKRKSHLTKRMTELGFNHVHIWDMFSAINYKDEGNVCEGIGLLLKMGWEFSLSKCFSGRSFEVIYSNTESDYGPTITFCER